LNDFYVFNDCVITNLPLMWLLIVGLLTKLKEFSVRGNRLRGAIPILSEAKNLSLCHIGGLPVNEPNPASNNHGNCCE
jgi:hypothetical protein